MKKSTIALGVIASLAVAGTGGAWFTGKMVEEKFNEELAIFSQYLKNQGNFIGHYEIENVRFERSFFSSDIGFDLVLKLNSEKLSDEEKAQVKNFNMPIQGKLYHGPFPLNRLSAFNFAPVMASLDLNAKVSEELKKYFTDSEQPIKANISVSYAKSFDGQVSFSGGEVSEENTKVNWAPTVVNYQYDGKELSYALPKLQMTLAEPKDKDLKEVLVEIEKVAGTMDTTFSSFGMQLGKQTSSVGKLKGTFVDKEDQQQSFEMVDIKVDYQAEQQDQYLNMRSAMEFGDFKLANASFGKWNMDFSFNHIYAPAWGQVFEVFKGKNLALFEDQVALGQVFEDAGLQIIEHHPQFKLDNFSIQNKDGKMGLKANLNWASEDIESTLKNGKVLKLFKEFLVSADVDKPALVNLLATVMSLPANEDAAQAKTMSETLVNQWAAQLKQQNIIVDTDNNMKSTLVLDGGQLKLNDTVIPEEMILLFLFGMGAH